MLQKPCALSPLMYMSHTNWQLGDWPLLPHGFDATEHSLAASGEGMELDQQPLDYRLAGHSSPIDSEKEQEFSTSSLDEEVIVGTLNVHKDIQNKQQKKVTKKERRIARKRGRRIEHAALVLKTKTKVDVLWQDGTKSCGIEASSLIPIECFGDHEFWPEQYVLDKSLDGDSIDHLECRVGKFLTPSLNFSDNELVPKSLKITNVIILECHDHIC
jgi:ubiquitin-conjugating enzyme E2 O